MQRLFPLLLLLLALANRPSLHAQRNPEAGRMYNLGVGYYLSETYDSAYRHLLRAWELEKESGNDADELFMGKTGYYLGQVAYEGHDLYNTAYTFYRYAVGQFNFTDSLGWSAKALKGCNNCYRQIDLNQLPFEYRKKTLTDPDTMQLVYMNVTRIGRRSGDTQWVEFAGGWNTGLVPGARASILTIYQPGRSDRANEVLGAGYVTSIDSARSEAYIVYNAAALAARWDTIMPDDLLAARCRYPAKAYRGYLLPLGILGMQFRDRSRDWLLWKSHQTQVTSKKSEEAILNEMVRLVRETGQEFLNSTDPAYADIKERRCPGGRYEGKSMLEAMVATELEDVQEFLNYVGTYPARYMGKSWTWEEIFATWLINSTPTGTNFFPWSERLQKTPLGDVPAFARSYRYYIENTEQADSLLNDYIWKLETYPDRIGMSERLIAFWESLKQPKKAVRYYENKVRLQMGEGDNEAARKTAKDWIALGEGLHNAYYFLGNMAYQEENYMLTLRFTDSALKYYPGHYSALVTRGWTLLLLANISKALPVCEEVFRMDSSSVAPVVNYAHCLLFTGKHAEARRLYDRTLTLLSSSADYYTGPRADFEHFISKGVMSDLFVRERDRMHERFQKEFYWKLLADSLFSLGKQYSNAKDYPAAHAAFARADEAFRKVPKPDYESLRNTARWRGYSYYLADDYTNSVVYYGQARTISEQQGLSDELLAADYRDLSNVYGYNSDTLRKEMYRDMERAVRNRMDERIGRKRLIMLSLGYNGSDAQSYRFAESDARRISQRLSAGAARVFDTVIRIDLLGSDCNAPRLQQTLKELRTQPNDVFLFSYAGPATTQETSAGARGIRLAPPASHNGFVSANALRSLLGDVQARKQYYFFDAPNAGLSNYLLNPQRKPSDGTEPGSEKAPASDQMSIFYLGMYGARIESEKDSGGAATRALLATLLPRFENPSISAKDMQAGIYRNLLESALPYALETHAKGADFLLFRHDVSSLAGFTDSLPPKLEIQRKADSDDGGGITRGGRTTRVGPVADTLSGRVLDESEVKLSINGKPVPVAGNGRFYWPIQSGVSELKIRAIDARGNATDTVVSLSGLIAPAAVNLPRISGERIALLIATDDYTNWDPLSNPVNDARVLGQVLSEMYGFKLDTVFNAGKERIMEKFRAYKNATFKDGDQLFVFVAGHGHYDNDYGGQMVCRESKRLGQDPSYSSYIRHEDIARWLDATPCKNVFWMMDLCFGGAMFRETSPIQYTGNTVKPAARLYEEKLVIPARQFITSGGHEEVPDGTPGYHSPFMEKMLIKLLSRKPGELLGLYDMAVAVEGQISTGPKWGNFGGDANAAFLLYTWKEMRQKPVLRREGMINTFAGTRP
jgi:hypothetical protein